MAFVRRKGNAFYLVHNVRRGGKVRQLHLARLGDRARITDRVVREVSKKHPFVELKISESPAVARELLVQLRLLQSTLQVKLAQFDQGRGRFGLASTHLRRR